MALKGHNAWGFRGPWRWVKQEGTRWSLLRSSKKWESSCLSRKRFVLCVEEGEGEEMTGGGEVWHKGGEKNQNRWGNV